MQRKSLLTGGVIVLSTAAMVFTGCQQAQPQKAPQQVVQDGMKNLTTVTSHQFELALNGDLNGPQGQTPAKVQFNTTLAGAVDLKDTQDPKINLTLDGSGSADAQSAAASAELRMNKADLYLILSKLTAQGGEPIPKEFTDSYVGKWWKITIPADTFKEFTANLPEYGSQQTLTPDQQKMKDLFTNTQFFKNIAYVGIEDVKGQQSYHYTADLDKDAVMKLMVQGAIDQGKPMTDADQKDMQTSMQKIDFSGGVWVAQDSGIMDQVSGDIKFANASPTDPTGKISVRVTLWDFNQPVTVVAPAGAADFPTQALMGAMLGGAPTGADTQQMMDITSQQDTQQIQDNGRSSNPVPGSNVEVSQQSL